MLIEEIRNIKSERSDLRKFGISVGIVLGGIGVLLLWKGRGAYPYLLTISVILIVSGLLFPRILLPLQKAWMTIAVIMGWFMTRVILCILFYLIFTPIGLVSRMIGNEFLELKIDRSRKSYWIYRRERPFDKKDYERQF
ncbi:MAG: hypothetical protein Fur0020_05910 [Thermodesulfovibrionia bacterium]